MIRLFHNLLFLALMVICLTIAACNDRTEPLPSLKQVVISGAIPPREAETRLASIDSKENKETPAALKQSPEVVPSPMVVPPVNKIEEVPAPPATASGEAPAVENDDAILGKNLDLAPEEFDEPIYSAKGKIDPFAPLVKDRTKDDSENQGGKKKPKRFLTPLEKLDLSQVKLVAVVMTKTGNIAMVEEASGKGYMVDIGTPMGRNGGKVAAIESDRITVVETVKDYKGTMVSRSHELILHKLENED